MAKEKTVCPGKNRASEAGRALREGKSMAGYTLAKLRWGKCSKVRKPAK